jgi:hypothetical protein
MIAVDRLRISLPAGFERRAERIARLVAGELAALPVGASASLDRLAVPAVDLAHGASDAQVAGSIARAIGAHLNGGGAKW